MTQPVQPLFISAVSSVRRIHRGVCGRHGGADPPGKGARRQRKVTKTQTGHFPGRRKYNVTSESFEFQRKYVPTEKSTSDHSKCSSKVLFSCLNGATENIIVQYNIFQQSRWMPARRACGSDSRVIVLSPNGNLVVGQYLQKV